MAVRSSRADNNVTTRSADYSLGLGGDLPIARIVALVLLLLPIVALAIANSQARQAPSEEVQQIAEIDPKAMFADKTPHFLPTPVAALPADADAAAPPAAADADTPNDAQPVERVKVANTGGVGVILRAEPPRGQQIGALRDGQSLEVMEHRTVGEDEWLHVRTPEGADGWVYSRLVVSSQ
jgi:hypothetical protein